jgi:hypothetical protein
VRPALAIVAAAVLAACGAEEEPSCPGEVLASFSFAATPRLLLGDPALEGGLDPDPAVPDCQEMLAFPSAVQFRGTIARDPRATTGALCRPEGPVLFGAQSGDRWRFEDGTAGAVLGACDPTCSAFSRVVVTGDTLRDEDRLTGFEGTLVQVLSQRDGACGACVLPCAARYRLLGTAE